MGGLPRQSIVADAADGCRRLEHALVVLGFVHCESAAQWSSGQYVRAQVRPVPGLAVAGRRARRRGLQPRDVGAPWACRLRSTADKVPWPRLPTARRGTLLDRPMTAELLRVGCIAHHQRLALSHSCSCSDRLQLSLGTTPATSLQSLCIPRVDPSIASPASFSRCPIIRRGICSQRHKLRSLPASVHPSPASESVCRRPTDTSLVICLPVVSRYKLWELSASGRPT